MRLENLHLFAQLNLAGRPEEKEPCLCISLLRFRMKSMHVRVVVMVKTRMLGDSNSVTATVAIWSQTSHKADLKS